MIRLLGDAEAEAGMKSEQYNTCFPVRFPALHPSPPHAFGGRIYTYRHIARPSAPATVFR